jgi:hypothetical protein
MPKAKPTTAFPETLVDLLSGKSVTVKPWTLKKGRLQRERITKIVDQLQEAGKNPLSLTDVFAVCEQQVYEIVRDTIDVTDEWMEDQLRYEDLFTLAQAVIQTCLLRPDGGGVLGKALAAMGKVPLESVQPQLQKRLDDLRAQAAQKDFPEPPKKSTSPSPEASPSSQDAGAAT